MLRINCQRASTERLPHRLVIASGPQSAEKFFETVNLDLTVAICSEHLSVRNFYRFGSSSVKTDPSVIIPIKITTKEIP